MELQPDFVLANQYQIQECLGTDLFASTYAAIRLQDALPVVIREWRPDPGQKHQDRWPPDVMALKPLRHPAIPRALDTFETEQAHPGWYLVQKRVQGQTLAQKLAQGKWHPGEAEVRQLAHHVLGVLHYLHQLSPPVIHRNLNPASLLIDGKDVFLIDFGASEDPLQGNVAREAQVYLAPEQQLGQAVPASDLYALGATLLHILSGRPPSEQPSDFGQGLNCSHELQAWLKRILDPDWENRFYSAAEARKALEDPKAVKDRVTLQKYQAEPSPILTSAAGALSPSQILSKPFEDSKIAMIQSEEHLAFHIQPGIRSQNGLGLIGTALLTMGGVLVYFWFEVGMRLSETGLWKFQWLYSLVVPLIFGFLWILKHLFEYLCLSTHLEFTPERYTFTRRMGNLNIYKNSGSLDEITGITSKDDNIISTKEKKYELIRIQRNKKHFDFGNWLPDPDQQKVRESIDTFLRNTRLKVSLQTRSNRIQRLKTSPSDFDVDLGSVLASERVTEPGSEGDEH